MITEAAIGLTAKQGEVCLTVLGDPGFYSRFGFRPASGFELQTEAGEFGEAFRVLALGISEVPAGTYRWHPAFASMLEG